MSLSENVRAQIRQALRVTGVSQAELARELGMSKKHVNQVLLGHAAMSFDLAEAMMAALGRRLSVTTTAGQPFDVAAGIDPFAIPPSRIDPGCGRCGQHPARYRGTDPARGMFCATCTDRCHDASEFDHICEVCAGPEERYP